jgi:hypothetical protein
METTELPPLNPLGLCPKCGHDRVSMEYKRGPVWIDFQLDIRAPGEVTECILRTCDRCGYPWAESTLLADLPGEPEVNESRMVQIQHEDGAIFHVSTVAIAMSTARQHKSVIKISFGTRRGERIRLVRNPDMTRSAHEWVYEHILDGVTD